MTNKEKFAEAYRRNLRDAVTAKPIEYAAIATKVDEVADKMLAAIERGSHNKDGYAFKKTCKELGIKHTYKDIHDYWTS